MNKPKIVAMLGNGKIWIRSEIDLEVLVLADNAGIWDVYSQPDEVEKTYKNESRLVGCGHEVMWPRIKENV